MDCHGFTGEVVGPLLYVGFAVGEVDVLVVATGSVVFSGVSTVCSLLGKKMRAETRITAINATATSTFPFLPKCIL
jgi:hypothetical protein